MSISAPWSPDSASSRRRWLRGGLVAVLSWIVGGAGCGYSLRPPFDETIRTVYVPIFRTVNTFRRDLNLRLTEAVIREIETSTPYKVVGSPEQADYILEGEIELADKNALIQNPNNLPRQVTSMVQVSVAFFPSASSDPQRGENRIRLQEVVNFYPETGETVLTAYDKVLTKLAKRIVSNLETVW
jgi:hypothetical protein